MNRPTGHHHPCTRCAKPVACDADQFYNHDGSPETVCEAVHVAGVDAVCDSCAAFDQFLAALDLKENV